MFHLLILPITLPLTGLDLLDDLPEDRSTLIDWLYSMQFLDETEDIAGFLGGFYIGRDNSGVSYLPIYDI